MTTKFTESTVEAAVLEWAVGLASPILYGPEIAPNESAAERESFGEVLLMGRQGVAIRRNHPTVPTGGHVARLSLVEPRFSYWIAHLNKSQRPAGTPDKLLLRLLSGELSVKGELT